MKDNSNPVAARHALIVQWLADEGRLDVGGVAGRLGVALETVRRDLRALESDGRLRRVHGGAVPVEAVSFPGLAPPPIAAPNDLAIATKLWAELPRTGTILLGTGRLTMVLAAVMMGSPPSRSGLTVVTNSLDAAIATARIPMLSVYNIGGRVSATSRAQEGDWALHELERLHVDVSVICPAGVTVEHGLGQPTPAAAAVSRAEVACGQTVIALIDAANLGRPAFVQFASLAQLDQLWVSGRPAHAVVQPFRERGLRMVVADDSVDGLAVPDGRLDRRARTFNPEGSQLSEQR
jgi:DeoR family transcriptional regulator, fructose operon transcriptional repressor